MSQMPMMPSQMQREAVQQIQPIEYEEEDARISRFVPQQQFYEETRRRPAKRRHAQGFSIGTMLHNNKKYLILVVVVFACIMFGVPRLANAIPNVVVAPTGQLNAVGVAIVSLVASVVFALIERYM